MSEMPVTADNNVANHLQKLARLYEHQQASQVMTRTLDKLLRYETEFSQEQLNELQADLRQFEQQYGFPSDEFFRQFQAGQTDDRMDYVEWASMVQMARNLEARLDLLSNG
jgi:hypothetical protein